MHDYVIYGDTDGLYININQFILDNIEDKDSWHKLSDEKKIFFIQKLSSAIENYVNDKSYREIQRKCYNSAVEDFRITFKQEIIAKSALFVKKKKYAYWCVNEEGVPTDKMSVTGLEIVRSDSSEAVRIRLKDIMTMILKNVPEIDLIQKINQYKKELLNVYPEEIAANIGINKLSKYIVNGKAIKGTPWHVRGVANYRFLLKELNIEDKYDDIHEGSKARVIYLRKNKFDVGVVSFIRWPKEFDSYIEIDIEKMIEKFFIKKIGILLEPMKKIGLLNGKSNMILNMFFN